MGSILGALVVIAVIILIYHCCVKASHAKSVDLYAPAAGTSGGNAYTYENPTFSGRDYNKDPEIKLKTITDPDRKHIPELYRAVEF